MKLKEIFTNSTFCKCVELAEYLLLITICICGFFWGMGFYYLGIPLAIVAAFIVITKVYHDKTEEDSEEVVISNASSSENETLPNEDGTEVADEFPDFDDEEDGDMDNDFDVESDDDVNVTYRVISEECEECQKKIPNGTFDATDDDENEENQDDYPDTSELE